jgi:hypothetical protein
MYREYGLYTGQIVCFISGSLSGNYEEYRLVGVRQQATSMTQALSENINIHKTIILPVLFVGVKLGVSCYGKNTD